ncbi:cupin domain-containing protein [Ammoniphilus sp. YIM 78166]|uniref:cupin domain-containing protein n=1 Tax=Ammoniphilus sp. YIM 78166 TaxID=1644106 RepID=UPI00106FABF1|nr:cupin domain-containing protein [Ammoniphilus sp. YIM 78166]
MNLYGTLGYYNQWYNPMHNYWNNNDWGNNYYHYYNRNWDWYNDSNLYGRNVLKDYGPNPLVININEATKQNTNFRTALWTGNHLQVTLMSIPVGEDIGLEIHPDLDQFIRIEQGQGVVRMGKSKNNLDFQARVHDDFAFVIPAGTWHNLINTDKLPLKLYSIYAPPQHPHGTVHKTKADAMAAE